MDSRFGRIVSGVPPIELVASGFGFTEGPVWNGDHLLFTDIARSRIHRWRPGAGVGTVEVVREPSNLANGLTLDLERRLVICEGWSRRLTRLEHDGSVSVLADRYQGERLNSPNDVVVRADGSIYFSDPFWPHIFENPFGPRLNPGERERLYAGVMRITPAGEVVAAADGPVDFEHPNGLTFSPDERVLYANDTRRMYIRAYEVQPDGSLANGRMFARLSGAEPGAPDGMKVDQEGNVYCTGPGGIWVFDSGGAVLGRIRFPKLPANLGWGGTDWQTLFATARTSVYRIRLRIPGAPVRR
ncbi:MAG: SMP-30/gluconolactonase/LRE family protein [Chloroflexi bacterium]|nr:SMP-30/gluconolactonase/LRE family protein [Chloroflexota bacterium]